MTITFTFPDDFDVFDSTETVTLKKVNASTGVEATVSDVDAIPEGPSEQVSNVGGVQIVLTAATWHLRRSSLGATIPDRDDKIVSTSDGMSGTWIIKSVRQMGPHRRYFVCETQKAFT